MFTSSAPVSDSSSSVNPELLHFVQSRMVLTVDVLSIEKDPLYDRYFVVLEEEAKKAVHKLFDGVETGVYVPFRPDGKFVVKGKNAAVDVSSSKISFQLCAWTYGEKKGYNAAYTPTPSNLV